MGDNNKIPKFSFSLNWVFAAIAIILVVLNFVDGSPAAKEIGYNEISTLIKKNAVEEITVTTNCALRRTKSALRLVPTRPRLKTART